MTKLGLDSIIFISYLVTFGSVLNIILGEFLAKYINLVILGLAIKLLYHKRDCETVPLPSAVLEYSRLDFK